MCPFLSGGLGYFNDEEGDFCDKVNTEIVAIQRVVTPAGAAQLKELIQVRCGWLLVGRLVGRSVGWLVDSALPHPQMLDCASCVQCTGFVLSDVFLAANCS